MDKVFARSMSALTTDFYRRVSASFSASRRSAWRGWDELCNVLDLGGDAQLRVLDVACGNLRFERFLRGRVPHMETWAYDNCEELVGERPRHVHYACADVAEALLVDSDPLQGTPLCDLAVSFGFMHHLPLEEQRLGLLRLLALHTRKGGKVAVAFWQFADDERLRAKARPAPSGGAHDYLLGWQDEPDVWRFCHHATEEEVDRLVTASSGHLRELCRFSADGRTGRLNRYVVLEVV